MYTNPSLSEILSNERERLEVIDLINAVGKGGFPSNWSSNGTEILFDYSDGEVYFVNADGQICGINPETGLLDNYINLPCSNISGFLCELLDDEEFLKYNEDVEWMKDFIISLSTDELETRCGLSNKMIEKWT